MDQYLATALNFWQGWGVWVGFIVAVGAAGWIFFDARRQATETTLWKVLTVVFTILVIPSLLFQVPALRENPNLQNAVVPLGYLGIIASIATLVTLIAYVASHARVRPRCPNCRKEWLDPTWPHCPYCGYGKTVPSPVPTPSPSMPISTATPTPVAASSRTELPAEPRIPTEAAQTMVVQKEAKLKPLAWLVARTGPRVGKEFALGDVTNIGRDATANEIILDDESISRQHARIRLEENKFVLYDLASANGTFVQNQESGSWRRTQKRALQDHDNVKFGEATFTFVEVAERRKE